MAWPFSSRQSMSSAVAFVEDDEEEAPVDTSDSSYCTSLECTCGKNCHLDPEYHSQVTRFDPNAEVDDDQYEYALSQLGAKG